MSCEKRLNQSFEEALQLPLTDSTRYVLISDCHRGIADSNDNFFRNQNLYFAALEYYYNRGFTYIELGDGDELWENRNMQQIIEVHSNIFWMLSRFYEEKRLYMIYGNHDMMKKNKKYSANMYHTYRCSTCQMRSLFPNIIFHPAIILQDRNKGASLYLTHGHQGDILNSTLWKLARFLVRYLWRPLEHLGFLDPTNAAKNYTKSKKIELKLSHWAKKHKHILITGHTHRPVLQEDDKWYMNTGSCVHPRCITCLEVTGRKITLVKWTLSVRANQNIYVAREVLEGPASLLS